MADPVLGADPAAMQGILRYGHGHLPEAAFVLLRVTDAAAARAWLAAAEVTGAAAKPEAAMQIALSHPGLQALGLPEAALAGFSDEFIAGMGQDENRSRRLGDIGANAPETWAWGKRGSRPDLMVMLYAAPGRLEGWIEALRQTAWPAGFEELAVLTTAPLERGPDGFVHEPFGFADGVSQPSPDWTGTLKPRQIEPAWRNTSVLGEFVLGYPNEYGYFTDRPLLDPTDDPEGLLPEAADSPGKRDLGRDGSYLVLRDLAQDVAGFWAWMDAQKATGLSAQAIAEAMVGRGMDGTPRLQGQGGIAGVTEANRFTFDSDPTGAACPLGAHIRRANPRNADMPGGDGGWLARLIGALGFNGRRPRDDLIAPTRFHRILRRGRSYRGEAEAGLRFVALGANISRQFEFVQAAWISGAKFDGLWEETDPLLGNRCPLSGGEPTDGFAIPQASGAPLRLAGLPQFITVRGGAYFFLPSLPALRWIAALR